MYICINIGVNADFITKSILYYVFMTHEIDPEFSQAKPDLTESLSSIKKDAKQLMAQIEQLAVDSQHYIPLSEFGTQVAEVRKRKGINQDDLALLANISISTLQKIEANKGNPTLKVMQSLGKALGIELWLSL